MCTGQDPPAEGTRTQMLNQTAMAMSSNDHVCSPCPDLAKPCRNLTTSAYNLIQRVITPIFSPRRLDRLQSEATPRVTKARAIPQSSFIAFSISLPLAKLVHHSSLPRPASFQAHIIYDPHGVALHQLQRHNSSIPRFNVPTTASRVQTTS